MGALELIFENGKAEGTTAEALLKILRKRGLHVDASTEARIRETHDLTLLDRWVERAFDASTIDEVLATPP